MALASYETNKISRDPHWLDTHRALERDNLVLAEVAAREIGRGAIAEALELTAPVARKQPHRYDRFAARWLCLYLEGHEKATLDDVGGLVSNLIARHSQRTMLRLLRLCRKLHVAAEPQL